MTSPKIPTAYELVWPVLRALSDLGGSGTNKEVAARVIEIEGFTEDQQSVMHTDGRQSVIEYRLHWARTLLRLYGAVENSERGVWSLTEKGRTITAQEAREIPGWYHKFKAERDRSRRAELITEEADDEAPSVTDAVRDEDDWKAQLLGAVMNMPPDGFERLALRLLREAGFTEMKVTGKSRDGGIDGVGVYRLSLVSFPIYFQCKKWGKGVGSKEVRDFRGAMAGRGDRGLLITTATFTAEAKKEAARDGAPPLDLIDGDRLCELLKEFDLGVQTESRVVETVSVNTSFFDEV